MFNHHTNIPLNEIIHFLILCELPGESRSFEWDLSVWQTEETKVPEDVLLIKEEQLRKDRFVHCSVRKRAKIRLRVKQKGSIIQMGSYSGRGVEIR